MRRATATAFVATFALAGCLQHEVLDLDGDGGTGTEDTDTTETVDLHFDKLDLIIVVDDSISMAQEQEMLATSVFDLVSSLAFPFGDPPYPAVEDVRAAVVSTNMGFSALGVSGDAYWPGDVPESCAGLGDGGQFKTSSTSQVVIESGAIPCAGLACHCHPDWVCALEDAGVGACEPPTPGDTEVDCPALGVMVVSDEDDCSMEDNEALFATEEIQDQVQKKANLACGFHAELLYSPEDLHDALVQAKGGVSGAVFFAAVVGVPVGPACEGNGKAIDDCLEHPDMQMIPEQPGEDDDPPNELWFFRPACTRTVGDDEVTRAYPGRRFVRLAQKFGEQGYVFSICRNGVKTHHLSYTRRSGRLNRWRENHASIIRAPGTTSCTGALVARPSSTPTITAERSSDTSRPRSRCSKSRCTRTR